MSFHLSMNFETAAELRSFLNNPAEYSAVDTVVIPATTPVPAEPPKPRGRPRKDQSPAGGGDVTSAAAAPSSSSAPSGSDAAGQQNVVEVAPPAPTTSTVTTLDDVRAVLADFNEKHGMLKSKQLLLDHGTTRISELAPDRYAAFVKAAAAVPAPAVA